MTPDGPAPGRESIGGLQDRYDFHGLGLAISCDDPAVTDVLRPRLRHFPPGDGGPADLAFEFRSVAAAGRPAADRPPGSARPVYDSPIGTVVYDDAADVLYLEVEDRLRARCEPARGRVRVSVLPAELDELWLVSHPAFTLPLIELLKRHGRYSLHAAGLASDGRALLLAGGSGSGKSTLALALARAGYGFLGDDMLFLAPEPGGLRALAFPDEVDVTDDTARLFPELRRPAGLPRRAGWPKRQVLVEDVYEVEVVREARPTALVFPRVAHADASVLEPLDRDRALLELVPNVLLTEARSSQAHLDALAELVRACACYRLETGRDLDALPALLRRLL